VALGRAHVAEALHHLGGQGLGAGEHVADLGEREVGEPATRATNSSAPRASMTRHLGGRRQAGGAGRSAGPDQRARRQRPRRAARLARPGDQVEPPQDAVDLVVEAAAAEVLARMSRWRRGGPRLGDVLDQRDEPRLDAPPAADGERQDAGQARPRDGVGRLRDLLRLEVVAHA
jgi:hypothetical protein